MSSTGTGRRPACPPASPLRPGTTPGSPGPPPSSPPEGLHHEHDKAAEAGKYLPEKNKIKNNEKSVLLTMRWLVGCSRTAVRA